MNKPIDYKTLYFDLAAKFERVMEIINTINIERYSQEEYQDIARSITKDFLEDTEHQYIFDRLYGD
tara:strand:- start:3012 stop:3209 length:198 start_codon:yes stop_codon:yes gene_type:complete